MSQNEQAGTLSQIWRYPIKSMMGESRLSGLVSWPGLVGDRMLLVRERQTGVVITAKQQSGSFLLRCSAAEISTPGVFQLLVDNRYSYTWDGRTPDMRLLGNVLSSFSGQRVMVTPPESRELPTNANFSLRSGVGVDSSPLHLITTATLEADPLFNVSRFRPNLVIQTPPGTAPFIEHQWVGRRLRIGGLELLVRKATKRCALPGRAQGGRAPLPAAPQVLRRVKDLGDNQLGAYAVVVEPDWIRVDDAVSLV